MYDKFDGCDTINQTIKRLFPFKPSLGSVTGLSSGLQKMCKTGYAVYQYITCSLGPHISTSAVCNEYVVCGPRLSIHMRSIGQVTTRIIFAGNAETSWFYGSYSDAPSPRTATPSSRALRFRSTQQIRHHSMSSSEIATTDVDY